MANKPARMKLSVGLSTSDRSRGRAQGELEYGAEVGVAYSYDVDVGVRMPTAAAFPLEPQVKEETLVFRNGRRPLTLLERRGPRAVATDEAGRKEQLGSDLLASETALGALADPARFPDLDVVRRTMLDWRFYHDFRSDRASPLRQPCLAVTTPTLASDGSDLAAVFATLVHIREDTAELDRAIDDAFPGARLVVPSPGQTAAFGLVLPDYPKRVFDAGELSDGTLRYLAVAGALLGYRLPTFIALNEPETSLHPELLEPLARMIVRAAERTQIWVVTHSERLAQAFADCGAVTPRTVVKRNGETWIEGLKLGGEFADEDDE
jgi:predicted ATPase